jgi:hypothetical protein
LVRKTISGMAGEGTRVCAARKCGLPTLRNLNAGVRLAGGA